MTLHQFASVSIFGQAVNGEEGQEEVFVSARDVAEGADLIAEIFGVTLGDGEGFVGELDLDEVDAVVGAVEQEVDLGSFRPGLVRAMNPAVSVRAENLDAQRLANLGQLFEG